ncbi:hypothetical protein RCO48_36845 [Peribacillus frigoritolerans]|nr:hypothetical protein [Peribacillus frigoritolerans]
MERMGTARGKRVPGGNVQIVHSLKGGQGVTIASFSIVTLIEPYS